MKPLFGFGISQEDPLTEQLVLGLQKNDRLLSIASGGEVPLTLMSLNKDIHVCAVDISPEQIFLCRIKLLAALHLDFPQNGAFLGYTIISRKLREDIYMSILRPLMLSEDQKFWDNNLKIIRIGVVNAGKFELYARKLRLIVFALMGKNNIVSLINSNSLSDQKKVFQEKIAERKLLKWLFKIAFRPSVYKNRGLQEQALKHADNTTGDRFFAKFRNFCTVGLAKENYFLQYYLTGRCTNSESLPLFLHPENKKCLQRNFERFELKKISFIEALNEKPNGYFNKIHLSNLGDWMNEDEFSELMDLVISKCDSGTKICSRHLHKNQFENNNFSNFTIDEELSKSAEIKDRFPFYGIQSVILLKET